MSIDKHTTTALEARIVELAGRVSLVQRQGHTLDIPTWLL